MHKGEASSVTTCRVRSADAVILATMMRGEAEAPPPTVHRVVLAVCTIMMPDVLVFWPGTCSPIRGRRTRNRETQVHSNRQRS